MQHQYIYGQNYLIVTRNMIMRYVIILLCAIFIAFCGCYGTATPSAPNVDDRIAASKAYLVTHELQAILNGDMPIRVHTPSAYPEFLIAFPLKEQNALASAKGLVELGIVFDFGPMGSYTVSRFPAKDGLRYFVILNGEKTESTGSRSVRSYDEL
jgi:hypothetical protein